MLKLLIAFAFAFLSPLCADSNASEKVTINEGAFTPDAKKKPVLNLDDTLNSAAKDAEKRPQRAPAARAPRQPFTPQGEDHTEDIVQAQKENKRRIGLG